jgi:hypothetical protein
LIDFAAIGGIFIVLIGIFFTIRYTHIRKNIKEMKENSSNKSEEIRRGFESTIANWKKGYSDSQVVIDFTARFCARKALEEELQRTYSENKIYEKIDIIGLISSVLLTIVVALGIDINKFVFLFYIFLILIIISTSITIITVITFVKMYREMDQFEDKLGISVSISDNH